MIRSVRVSPESEPMDLGQAEVGDLRRPVVGQEDVGRLEVAVDDPQPMSLGDPGPHLSTIRAAAMAGQGVPSIRRPRLPAAKYSIE